MPADVDAQLQAANLLILAGRFADAQDRANRVLERDPHNVRATVTLGNALAGLKDMTGAIAQLEEAIRLDPTRAGSYSNLATLQLGAGKLKEAETAYLQAVEKAPDSVPSLLALAQFYWLTSRPDEATTHLQRALEDRPARHRGQPLCGRFLSGHGPSATKPSSTSRQPWRQTARAGPVSLWPSTILSAERLPEATAVLKTLTSDREVGTTAKVRLATIDYASGRAEAAHAAIDEILKASPHQLEALLVKASMLFDQKRFDEALVRTNEAIKGDPSSAPAYFAKGKVLVAQSRWDEAKEAFNQVLKLNPRAAGAEVELAKLHLQTGATDTAVTLAGAAVTSDPRRADARIILARGLIVRGELNQAESILKILITAMPDSPIVHAQMGWLHLAKKELPARHDVSSNGRCNWTRFRSTRFRASSRWTSPRGARRKPAAGFRPWSTRRHRTRCC